ncbi:MAG: hypothetical protein ACI8TX_001406 [Hyphomicrobiaceae bacterium]
MVTNLPSSQATENETTILASGIFNMGFFAVRDSTPGEQFLRWLSSRVQHECVNDRAEHRYLDQRWADLVPAIFDEVGIDQSLGSNVAYWNLFERPLTKSATGQYMIGQTPLTFFHFSGFDPRRQESISKHQSSASKSEVLQELIENYKVSLLEQGASEIASHPYGFAALSDGTPISDAWREAVRKRAPELEDIEDPFDTKANPNLVNRM